MVKEIIGRIQPEQIVIPPDNISLHNVRTENTTKYPSYREYGNMGCGVFKWGVQN